MDAKKYFEDIVGEKYFSTEPAVIEAYRETLFPLQPPKPFGVILPETVDEVVRIIKLCNKLDMPLVPIAVGAPINGLTVCHENGLVVDLSRMNKIIDINPDTMVAVIEPGVTIGQMIKALEPYNLMTCYPNSTTGVSVLANMVTVRGIGQLASKYGTSDYFLQGVEAVLGSGEVLITGSGAVDNSDWHFRYCLGPDLNGLFIGSAGTMGIITKAAVKLIPIPEDTWSVALAFDKIQDAVNPIHHIGKHQMADYINGQYWYTSVITNDKYPWEITGGKKTLPQEYMEEWRKRKGLPPIWFHLALGDSKRVVEAKRKDLEAFIKQENLNVLDMSNDEWYHVRDVQIKGTISTLAPRFVSHRGGGWSSLVMMAPVKKWGTILDPVIEKGKALGFDPTYLLKVYGPYGHTSQCRFVLSYNRHDPDESQRAKEFTRQFTQYALQNGGVIHRQTLQPEVVMSSQSSFYNVLKKIKKAVDPNAVMNRGILGLDKENS